MSEPTSSEIKVLREIYTDEKHPASFSSINKLYKAAKAKKSTITISKTRNFLEGERSSTLHKQAIRRFPRRRFIVKEPGDTVFSDVAYVKEYEKNNPPYLVLFLDGFSKYLSVYPVKNLKSNSIIPVLNKFFNEDALYKYLRICSDRGVEYISKPAKNFYKKNNLTWYTTKSEDVKISPVERCVRTLKTKIFRIITHSNCESYHEKLEKIVESYNFSPHGGLLGLTPVDAHLLTYRHEIDSLLNKMNIMHVKKCRSVVTRLSPHTVVRLTSLRRRFARGFHHKATTELFKVSSVNDDFYPPTYKIEDLEGNPVEGTFYLQELVRARDTGVYLVKIVKKQKIKGVVKYLISWPDYPKAAPEWKTKSELKKIV